MENAQKQLVDRIRESNNVLVTVSNDPSIDQLAAAVGLTLMLNALGKHATAVYSGKTPSVIEFLQPDQTIEKNTDSLRDFIISLDKSKADKLRYKVEDKMVKVFITPFKSSITEHDLVFSQGDFNVDVVVAIGVHKKEELDQAITSHGRILHDATVSSINTTADGQLGSIGLTNTKASSLCEIVVGVCQAIKPDVIDEQMATAFLTGIVAETERFSNEKTSSQTMNISAVLMGAGANQQLVSTKLQEPEPEPEPVPEPEQPEAPQEEQVEQSEQPAPRNDGVLEVVQDPEDAVQPSPEQESGDTSELEQGQNTEDHPLFADSLPPVQSNETDNNQPAEEPQERRSVPAFMTEPPTHGGTLTANSRPDYLNTPLSSLDMPSTRTNPRDSDQPELAKQIEDPKPEQPEVPQEDQLEQQDGDINSEQASGDTQTTPPDPMDIPVPDTQTLEALEQAVESPHQQNSPPLPDPNEARQVIEDAMNSSDTPKLDPAASLNASGFLTVDHDQIAGQEHVDNETPQDVTIDPSTGEITFPSEPSVPVPGITETATEDSTAPPVPPPFMPPQPNDNVDDDMALPPVNY